jgi:hypothetical protein
MTTAGVEKVPRDDSSIIPCIFRNAGAVRIGGRKKIVVKRNAAAATRIDVVDCLREPNPTNPTNPFLCVLRASAVNPTQQTQ